MKKSRLKTTWEIIHEGRKNLFDFKLRQFAGLRKPKKSKMKPVKFKTNRFNSNGK